MNHAQVSTGLDAINNILAENQGWKYKYMCNWANNKYVRAAWGMWKEGTQSGEV